MANSITNLAQSSATTRLAKGVAVAARLEEWRAALKVQTLKEWPTVLKGDQSGLEHQKK